MKKIFFLALLSAVLSLVGCVDFYEPEVVEEEIPQVVKPDGGYKLKANASIVATNDSIYGAVEQEILFFIVDSLDNIVACQIDFGDGTLDGGSQILHKYKVAGIYKLKATVVGKNKTLERNVKITAPSTSTSTAETIVQLSGNTVGDSAAIKLLCLKNKIYNYRTKGKYFLKGDINNWKTAIEASDTNFIYNGAEYLLFNIKVRNYAWASFGYYKTGYDSNEHWGYDPNNKYWSKELGLYRFYVAGAQIYATQLTAEIPGACGDASSSSSGPCIRLDYQTNGAGSDSLVLYANRNYLTTSDSTKIGISYTVDGGAVVIKRATFIKNNNKYVFVKVPVTKSSAVRFKTYKDVVALTVGDMTSSIFYSPGTGDCYLTIAGSMQKAPSRDKNGNDTELSVIAANGNRLKF